MNKLFGYRDKSVIDSMIAIGSIITSTQHVAKTYNLFIGHNGAVLFLLNYYTLLELEKRQYTYSEQLVGERGGEN